MPLLALLALAQSPQARLDALARDYGIEIRAVRTVVRSSRDSYSVVAHPLSDAQIARYVPIFEAEWRRYPPSLMRRVGLRRIVLGADVRVEGQPRAVVPETDRGWFWLDAGIGGKNPAYGRHALHHDFFHMVDDRSEPRGYGDRCWAALNAPGTRYGIGGWWMQTKGVGELRRDLPGFLTAYATSAVEEDKAEVFGHLLTSPAFVAERAADPVVAAKVAMLKAQLAAFEPAMGEAWWAAQRGAPTLPSPTRVGEAP